MQGAIFRINETAARHNEVLSYRNLRERRERARFAVLRVSMGCGSKQKLDACTIVYTYELQAADCAQPYSKCYVGLVKSGETKREEAPFVVKRVNNSL